LLVVALCLSLLLDAEDLEADDEMLMLVD